MSYITREDGEHFVIPSYRDVLSAKQKNILKRDILMLSQNYGEYITMQKKGTAQFEVAFSPDRGYLLGESIWHYFKRPLEMIYCEAIPNTTEAILVIVKNGSVYLDGTFPLDSIPEELIIFLTQQNNFEIYIYGDVPISQTQQEGKFNFEATSIKSFTVLDKPVFPTLPLLKIYQLQLVDIVLKSQGIGVFPAKQLLLGIVVLGLLWISWSYITSQRVEAPKEAKKEVNPYEAYNASLMTPAPEDVINRFLEKLRVLFTMPGWTPTVITYAGGTVSASVQTLASKTEELNEWAKQNNATVDIQQNGIYVHMNIDPARRTVPTYIYPLKSVLAHFIDRLSNVYPGNHLKLGTFDNKGVYSDVPITIDVEDISPIVLSLIGEQFKGLPIIVQTLSVTLDKGSLTGTINIDALGS